MKRKLIIGLVISVIFLYLAFRGIQWSVLWEVLGRTHPLYLIPSMFFSVISFWFRAYRWKFMLLPVKSIPTHSLFSATMIGYMANNLLPARLGELVRAYALGRQEGISKTASFATIVYERIVDVFFLLVLLWWSLVRTPGAEWLETSGMWLLIINVIGLILLMIMERRRTEVHRVVGKLASPLPERLRSRLTAATDAFLAGLASLRQAGTFLPIVWTSAATWIATQLGFYFCFFALDIEVPFVASALLTVLVAVGSMLPSAPAYVGATQYACVVGLGLYAIEKSEALAYSLLYHASIFIPITLIGLFYLWKAQIGLGELSRQRRD